MFIVSHVEGKAVLAALPQIVGHIHTAIGRGTLTRVGGTAVEVMVGDPVCQGDAIEAAVDGRIGIRFIDGSLFNVSGGARVVLDEFVCDADGTPHSALLAVSGGNFAFMAGQMAETGSLRVDTPVGRIRGRAHAGGFGLLSLTALTFAMMKDVEAADPNVTLLDDDDVTYKDLKHGVLELVTKEAIPRHIIIDDPGQTVILKRIGSSVSISQVANTPSRMDELHAAQQELLANLANGPDGSSSLPTANPFAPHPINFIQDQEAGSQQALPPLPEVVIPNVITKPPQPPILNAGLGPIEADTAVFDTFKSTTGTFTASTSNVGTLTFGIVGATAGSTVLNGLAYDESETGSFGTLYLNSESGAYTFVPNNIAINALKTPTTESFVITVSDGTLSASRTFTIIINGVEDAAIISGATAGSVIEAGAAVNATPGLQTATGTLTDTDPDDPTNTFTAVSSPTKSAGGYGTFTMTTDGVWTYTLDEANSAVQALKVGDTLTDAFTVTSIDGTPEEVTITIRGPMVGVTGTAPSLTLSEAHLTATALDDNIAGSAPDAALTTISGDFSTAFISVQGVDGATISYALSITGGNGAASGLIDSHTGVADVLVQSGNTIEGHIGTIDGALAFTISVDPTTGVVTFTEFRAVAQPFGTNPDGGEGVSLPAGIVNLSATITDGNGSFQTVSRDLGNQLTITDDGPTIVALATAPSLTLSETHLTATALDDNIAGSAPDATLATTSSNFSTAFTAVQGADGSTISYALSIAGGNGAASGLIDSHTGEADVLVLNGNTIEGHVGTAGGTLAFTVQLDPTTGLVTFTEYRAVMQPFGTNPDGGEAVSLTAGIVNLTATITDSDGDFQTATLDLGSRLTITDDGPMIGSFDTAIILAQDNQVANGTYHVNFGADGDAAMLVAVHDGAVNGYNLATTDLGGGITSVHVTGNGDDYTFYYTTQAVNGGVQLNAFFADTGGTLSDPFFTLLINPDGTYTFDIDGVGFLQQTTVTGSDFGASGGGQLSLTAPDGLLVITGDFNGAPADVKASSNGIAVGDTGLQMDQNETLVLTFTPPQTDVSFSLTQWQGNGTADVVFKVFEGATEIHDFNINIPKPSGDARIVVEETSNLALVNTYTFDSATSTYTLYVGSEYNQIGVSYDHAVTGNTTFTVNNITYSEGTRIPSTDLLFDVTAVDRDNDASTTSLQVDLLGSTSVASGLASSATPPPVTTNISSTSDAAIISAATTGAVNEAGGVANATPATPIVSGTLTDTDVGNIFNTFTAVSTPTVSAAGYGTFTITAAGVWTYALDSSDSAVRGLNVGGTLTDSFTVTTIDGTPQVVTVTINGSNDGAIISGTTSGSVIEAGGISPGTPIASGTPTGSDVDNLANAFTAVGSSTRGDGGYGMFTMTAAGVWTFTLDHANPVVDALNVGDTLVDGFTVHTVDDTAQMVPITIHGASDDPPLVHGTPGHDGVAGGDDVTRIVHGGAGNGSRFDTISDFDAGSDKIDLTALGALAFLALSSTSTSVPAHTIAWRYDSASNETVVYVNPTDQALKIGDSNLVEVHLQGIASVQASDFIDQPAAPAVAAVVAGDPIDLALAATAEDVAAVAAANAADVAPDRPSTTATSSPTRAGPCCQPANISASKPLETDSTRTTMTN